MFLIYEMISNTIDNKLSLNTFINIFITSFKIFRRYVLKFITLIMKLAHINANTEIYNSCKENPVICVIKITL